VVRKKSIIILLISVNIIVNQFKPLLCMYDTYDGILVKTSSYLLTYLLTYKLE